MAILTVTTTADTIDGGDGKLSLREAVLQANATGAADTIRFAASLEGQSILLTGGELQVLRDLTIEGDTDQDGLGVTIDGNQNGRVLSIEGSGSDVALSGLMLTGGAVSGGANGGAIDFKGASLTISHSRIIGNQAGEPDQGPSDNGSGGAINIAGGRVTITDSDVSDNYAASGPGAIHADSADLIIRNSLLERNEGPQGGAIGTVGGRLVVESSQILDNDGGKYGTSGGGISVVDGIAWIARSSINGNSANYAGGINIRNSQVTVTDSTIADNRAFSDGSSFGGGIGVFSGGFLHLRNSTVTGNATGGAAYFAYGGGVSLLSGSTLEVFNSIVAGNRAQVDEGNGGGHDISGTIAFSNGHNIFGSDVLGNVSGDRESIAASAIFASIDPATGGGQVNAAGIVPLRNALTNPALSGADPLAASDTGQLGTTGRPLPAGSLPDVGSIEINRPLTTTASANNDVLSGTGSANAINGLAGADFIKGQGGNDTLRGGDGGDLLDGGAGKDKLYGDAGIDLVFYGGSTKVVVDLSLATDKATRGSEVDTLYNVEGAIGSTKNDVFKGNEHNNLFQGGLGKDTATGGAGRDLYDFNAIADSKVGASTRDVITDFAHLVDKIDLMGIDADTVVAGNQAFRWVGTSALTGPGEVGYFTSGGNTILRASNDADATSEFEIQLTGIRTLTAADFYL